MWQPNVPPLMLSKRKDCDQLSGPLIFNLVTCDNTNFGSIFLHDLFLHKSLLWPQRLSFTSVEHIPAVIEIHLFDGRYILILHISDQDSIQKHAGIFQILITSIVRNVLTESQFLVVEQQTHPFWCAFFNDHWVSIKNCCYEGVVEEGPPSQRWCWLPWSAGSTIKSN